jgi:hypothetical protein
MAMVKLDKIMWTICIEVLRLAKRKYTSFNCWYVYGIYNREVIIRNENTDAVTELWQRHLLSDHPPAQS